MNEEDINDTARKRPDIQLEIVESNVLHDTSWRSTRPWVNSSENASILFTRGILSRSWWSHRSASEVSVAQIATERVVKSERDPRFRDGGKDCDPRPVHILNESCHEYQNK